MEDIGLIRTSLLSLLLPQTVDISDDTMLIESVRRLVAPICDRDLAWCSVHINRPSRRVQYKCFATEDHARSNFSNCQSDTDNIFCVLHVPKDVIDKEKNKDGAIALPPGFDPTADGTIVLPQRLHGFDPTADSIIQWCKPILESRAPIGKDWSVIRFGTTPRHDVFYWWCDNQEAAYEKLEKFRKEAATKVAAVFYVSLDARVSALADRVKSRVGDESGRVPNDEEMLQRNIMDKIARASEQHKTHIYVYAESVPPNFVSVLKRHFYVQPVSTNIGREVLRPSEALLHGKLEDEYLRICWSSWGMASMKDQEDEKEKKE